MNFLIAILLFNILSLISIFLPPFYARLCGSSTTPNITNTYRKLQWEYLIPYLLITTSDWLQGPYVYVLYSTYGFSLRDISLFFVTGFASSMIIGTFVGSLADTLGRKKICLVFVVLYIISCATKHTSHFHGLLLGRVVGGVATSILFSTFDAWLVYEHQARGFHSDWLSHTFSLASIGNSATAIAAGIIATTLNLWTDTLTAPFDIAIIFLIAAGVIIYLKWPENYGDMNASTFRSFSKSVIVIRNNPKIIALGLIQSFFESTMYIFVFMWSPILARAWGEDINYILFACLMVSVMIGSTFFRLNSSQFPIEKLLFYQFVVAAIALLLPVFFGNAYICLASFLIFECCVGVFWPSLSTLRSNYIPEEVRSTIMNFYRIPTNLFVLSTFIFIEFSTRTVFLLCVALLACGAVASYYFQRESKPSFNTSLYKNRDEKGSDSDDAFEEMMKRTDDTA